MRINTPDAIYVSHRGWDLEAGTKIIVVSGETIISGFVYMNTDTPDVT
jgi:hypothetical protein